MAQTPSTIPATCPIGRRQEFDNYMHSPNSLGRRISSVNCTRIHFHVSKIKGKRANPTTKKDINENIARQNRKFKHYYDYEKKNAIKPKPADHAADEPIGQVHSTPKQARFIPKPREVLTPHGILYIAALCSFYKENNEQGGVTSDKTSADSKGVTSDETPADSSADSSTKPGKHSFKNQILDRYRCDITGAKVDITQEEATLLQLQLNDMNSAILDDMSKGDWIAKILFVFQAGWMILQVCKTIPIPISIIR